MHMQLWPTNAEGVACGAIKWEMIVAKKDVKSSKSLLIAAETVQLWNSLLQLPIASILVQSINY